MIYLSCRKCSIYLRVSPGTGGEAEAMFSPESIFRCWKCGWSLDVGPTLEEPGADVIDVSPQEAYAAIMGLGLPEEKDCTAAAVIKLLTEKSVVRVSASQIRNSHRCIIDFLELEDGTRVYFGSSAYGATVYRVTPKHSYVGANDG